MTQFKNTEGFSGILGGIAFSTGFACLRLYPFAFDLEAPEPVLEVRIDEPNFSEEILKPFLHEEVEVEFGPCGLVMEGVWHGLSIELNGNSLSATFAPYSLRDYIGRVKFLNQALAEKALDSHRAGLKLKKMKILLAELMRRAEIKAAASEMHRAKQLAAMNVISRIQVELELDD